ncbi:MAG TPA: hypothetical protein VMU95_39555 [Trebonia sp.]|nr:hypothetical protein [Trebonia sp.]
MQSPGGLGAPIGKWAVAGVAVTAFGGPLALAALNAPGIVADATSSAGLEMVAAAVAFALPLWLWLDYSREVSGSGGLYDFTRAAAGQQVALIQAGLWIISYVLYLLYTTAQIVYDTLPAVLPGEVRYQTLLEIVIPVALAAVMIAGRTVALLVIGALAAGQLALAAVVGGLTVANITTPVSTFGGSAPAGSVAIASGQTALLYICGSLPFFLGGEASRAHIRQGVVGAYLATAAVIVLAVAPLAAGPSLASAEIPGMEVAQRFAGHGLAVTVGIAVVASIAGVMLVEYLALSRLITAVTAWPVRRILVGIGVAMVAFAPVILINPDEIYDDLITPSLVALWLSQMVVFAVYPRYAASRGRRVVPASLLAAACVAFAGYGVWSAIHMSGAS